MAKHSPKIVYGVSRGDMRRFDKTMVEFAVVFKKSLSEVLRERAKMMGGMSRGGLMFETPKATRTTVAKSVDWEIANKGLPSAERRKEIDKRMKMASFARAGWISFAKRFKSNVNAQTSRHAGRIGGRSGHVDRTGGIRWRYWVRAINKVPYILAINKAGGSRGERIVERVLALHERRMRTRIELELGKMKRKYFPGARAVARGVSRGKSSVKPFV